jgi:hypothetical protein
VTRPQGHAGGEEPFDDEVRDVYTRVDPVPDAVLADARRARTGSGPADSDLLELVYDSVLDVDIDRALESGFRLLSFGGGVRVDLRVESCGEERRLVGWTAPVCPQRVSLRTERETTRVRVLPDGSFCTSCEAQERVSILLDFAPDVPVRHFHTSWVLV